MAKIGNLSSIIQSSSNIKKIIFTHGTYDTFHIGHFEFLKETKKQGGLLIVGVDHDSNTALYKKALPIINQKSRVKMVASLNFIDYVLPIPEIYPNQRCEDFYFWLYAVFRPDIVTYGSNFSMPDILRRQCSELHIKDIEIKHKFSHVITSSKIRPLFTEEAQKSQAGS